MLRERRRHLSGAPGLLRSALTLTFFACTPAEPRTEPVSGVASSQVPSAAPESALQKAMREAAGDASVEAGTFDRNGGPLPHVDVQMCKESGGPTGAGHARLTFANDGTVTDVKLDAGPFGGTSVGACIEARFRTVKVAPFSGKPVQTGKSFVVN